MKSLFTTGVLLLSLAGSSLAQNKSTYIDDIYYNSKDKKKEFREEEVQEPRKVTARESNFSSSEDEYSYNQEEELVDERSRTRNYEDDNYAGIDDEYYYSTQINRFNYPFYNRPYWSSFYNPYWYDSYWVDPNWGWNPWSRPVMGLSYGMGPYWTSYWGWQSWYGFGGFSSYWGGPMSGFGGGGYYTGFWNGYYAGLYNTNGINNGRYRSVTYGPRYSMNGPRNSFANNGRSNSGFRRQTSDISTQRSTPSHMEGPRANTQRLGNNSISRPGSGRSEGIESENRRELGGSRLETMDREAPIRSSDRSVTNDRGSRTFGNGNQDAVEASPRRGWNPNGAVTNDQMATPGRQPGQGRSGIFGGRGAAPSRGVEQPRMQQSAPSQPRMQQQSSPAPRMSTPSRSFGNGGGRSFGGSGGGSMRGGGGRR